MGQHRYSEGKRSARGNPAQAPGRHTDTFRQPTALTQRGLQLESLGDDGLGDVDGEVDRGDRYSGCE